MKNTIAFSLALLAACAAAGEIRILAPADGSEVPLLTDAQKAYVSMDRQTRREKFADPVFRCRSMGLPAETVPGEGKPREAYWPKTVRLAWEAEDGVEYRVKVRDAARAANCSSTTSRLPRCTSGLSREAETLGRGLSGQSPWRRASFASPASRMSATSAAMSASEAAARSRG